MIGQEKLLKSLKTFTSESFPQSSIFVGENGCGKHTIVSMLSTEFNKSVVNISDKLTYEKIVSLFLEVEPHIYLIDKEMSYLEQNSLLKFIEEPPQNSNIIILTENENSLLETIIGRCCKFKFDSYTKEELSNFSSDETLLEYFKTPGELLAFNSDSLWVFDLCNTILEKLSGASIPNTLTLSKKFKFKKDDDEDKFDINIFMKLLLKKCVEYNIKDPKYGDCYLTISKYFNKMKLPNVNKQNLFELCLLDMKVALK